VHVRVLQHECVRVNRFINHRTCQHNESKHTQTRQTKHTHTDLLSHAIAAARAPAQGIGDA